MNKENDFEGELMHIEPYRLVKNDKNNDLDDFFLVLGAVFNDLKGLDFLERLFVDKYRKPEANEETVHAGEYAGLLTQTRKIFISSLREFLDFLENNKEVLETTEFKGVLEKTSKDTQKRWNNIVDIALSKKSENIKDFTEYLIEVRNNVAFHYNQPKGIRNSFRKFFYKKDKIMHNQLARYYIGEDMKSTRFFYADAAVQEYLRSASGDEIKGLQYKYENEVGAVIVNVCYTILRLLKAYLKSRPK